MPPKCKNCGHSQHLHYPWCTDAYRPGICNFQYDLCSCTNYEPVDSQGENRKEES